MFMKWNYFDINNEEIYLIRKEKEYESCNKSGFF